MNAPPVIPKRRDPAARRIWWEIRRARLQLALAENELAWAHEALISGRLNATGALRVLDETLTALTDEIGARP